MMFSDSPIGSWRQFGSRYRLEGMKCSECATIFYPQKYRCSCGSIAFTSIKLSGRGTVVSFTENLVPGTEFSAMAPYLLAVIQLEEGPRMVAQLCDVTMDDVTIGMSVVGVLRKYYVTGEKGIIHYGIKFMPQE